MSDPRPTYTTRRRRDDPDANAAAIIADTRREVTNRALNDADAAQRALLALVAEVARLRNLLSDDLGIDTLIAVGHALRDLRQCAEALGVGL